jgi:hypothetical protein
VTNNLSTCYPHLIVEWNVEKNGSLTPHDVTQKSKKKVWWKCARGHEWEAVVGNRANGSGCPICKPRYSKAEIRFYCELLTVFPDTKNQKKVGKNRRDIYIPSHRIVIEYDGNHWHRNKFENDCERNEELLSLGVKTIRVREAGLLRTSLLDILVDPNEELYDAFIRLLKTLEEILVLSPLERARFQDYLKYSEFINTELYIEKISHTLPEFDNSVASIPKLCQEWDYERNINYTPEMFSLGSRERVWWKCEKGHVWKTRIGYRTAERHQAGCPECAGQKLGKDNHLAVRCPELVGEWDIERNNGLRPDEVSPGNKHKVWWRCIKGHNWQATIRSRAYGKHGCPHCYNECRKGTAYA